MIVLMTKIELKLTVNTRK